MAADIVVPEYLPADALAELTSSSYDVLYDEQLHLDAARLAEHLGGARALVIRNRTRVDAGMVAAASRLRVIGRLGAGLDNIDLEACRAAGIEVRPAAGANAVSVAEYVFGAILVLVRGVYAATEAVAAGEWPRRHAHGTELMGKILGIVGLGAIGRRVAARARAFEMEVLANDPFVPADDPAWQGVRRVDLEEVLRRSDIVTLHVPLDATTRGLIDAAALALLRPTAVLINTSRGGIVDEDALADALRIGALGGAAVDVFATEPLDAAAGARFVGLPNLLLTPHLAGNTFESIERVARVTVVAVLEALGGPGE